MAERETKTLTTPNNHSIVVKSYLSGRELNSVKRALLQGITAQPERGADGNPVLPEVPVVNTIDREEALIRIAVISVDGVIEDAGNKAIDLEGQDYQFVVDEVEKIAKGF
jgi:hypothetical protein